jgi:(1->4)-alpha-D-glucan 1-alpha-D-glucosylmutase
VSGPATAKGIEDTALYRYAPLLSLNEVGSDPARDIDDAPALLHAANAERNARWPSSLLAATTHDTKRSADVRARVIVLSEIPEEWRSLVARWHRAHRDLASRARGRVAPDVHTEYVLYQTLVGMWPAAGAEGELDSLRERVEAYAIKGAREAKARTSWTDPDDAFERALSDFIARLFARPEFVREAGAFAARIAPAGALNAIARMLVQLTAPGVPDLYQGDELWNFTLVDPDNRRPVDFALRASMLTEVTTQRMSLIGDIPPHILRQWVATPASSHLKLHVIRAALALRAQHATHFAASSYEPLEATGAQRAHLFAFLRRSEGVATLTVIPRLTYALAPDRPPLGDVWGDTALVLPAELAGSARWHCAISGRDFDPNGATLPVARLFELAPVALLHAAVAP